MSKMEQELIESLSELEHDQWEDWSKAIAKLLNEAMLMLPSDSIAYRKIEAKLMNWEDYWVPYEELTNDIQEYDRVYARKILKKLEETGFSLAKF